MKNIEKAVRDFLSHCKHEKKLSEKTLKAYSIDLQQFLKHLDAETNINDLPEVDKHVLSGYLNVIYEKGKPKTIKRKIATLRAFFNYLEFEDRVVVSPFRKMTVRIKQEKTQPETLTLDEIKLILDCVYRLRRESRYSSEIKQKALIRDIAILELLFATGMRVSELCNLEVGNVDLDKSTIRIRGTGNRERTIPIYGEECTRAMQVYRKTHSRSLDDSKYWFLNRDSKRISDQSVRALIAKYAKQAGLDKNITPHTFRHTVATLLLESGVDIRFIQYFLGHSSITTTQVYVQINEDTQRSILKGNHPRGKIEVTRGRIVPE